MDLIFQDRFWSTHIPLVCIVKIQPLEQFPIDCLSHPVMSTLVLFLYQFTSFTYVIDCFCIFTYSLHLLIIIFREFFTPILRDGFLLGFEWYQVSSNLQDSSLYSGWFKKCCSLDGLNTSSNFWLFQSLYQSFRDCTEHTNYTWCQHHSYVP